LAVILLVPPMIVPKINSFLADFSPLFHAQIAGLRINPFRGAYGVSGLEVSLKAKPEEKFIQTELIDVSIAWRDLLRGQFTTDILIRGSDVLITDQVLQTLRQSKEQAKKDSKKAVDKVLPLRIERIDIKDSEFEIANMRKIPKEGRWRLSDINGRVSNATATEKSPVTLVSLRGDLLDSAPLKIFAQANGIKKPFVWDADIEIKDFDLTKANPVLKRKLPLTFTSGKFDLYSEIKSEDGVIRGYAKPFFKKADVISQGETFSGLRHYGIEASTAAVNMLLRNAKDKTMATKVLFTYNNGDLEINSAKAISDAIGNSFENEVPEGIEDEISLSENAQKPIDKGDKP
ncbi:MAG: DUF748 domain-containing protein, partial [Pseudobdellovibrionaceae bacterium]